MKRLIIKRENLYQAIWKESMQQVADKYQIAVKRLKEICEYLEVPTPDSSYWAKYRAGKNPKRKKLPENSEQKEWIEYINEYELKRKEELNKDSLAQYPEKEREKIRKVCNSIDKNKKINVFHPLVIARNSNQDMPEEQLEKYEIRESKEIKERIDRIYHILFSTIEKLGYTVQKEDEKYVAIIKEEKIPFKIREKAKIQYRTPTENDSLYRRVYVKGEFKIREIVPSGNLELKIDHYGKKPDWNDTPKTKLEDRIGEILIELFYCAIDKKRKRLEREEEHRKYQERERKKAEKRMLLRPNELRQLFEIGKKISKIELGLSGSKIRVCILEDVIEKVVLHLGSFTKIINNCRMEELDISMLATIARNIMECGNTYFYYAERKISDEEIEFRYHIANLHYDNSVMDIIKKMEYPQNNFRTSTLQWGKELMIKKIKESSIYQELSKIEKSQVLNGNQAYHSKRQKELHTILDRDIESAIYNIFSNSAHSYYLGLGTNSMNGSFAHASYIKPEMVLCLAMEISIVYSANILVDYLQLRKTLNQYLTEEEKGFIKNMMSLDKLLEWLETQKEEYQDTFFDMKWIDDTEEIVLK